jgi:hypothetical protein
MDEVHKLLIPELFTVVFSHTSLKSECHWTKNHVLPLIYLCQCSTDNLWNLQFKWVLTSPTGGGRSVGIVRSRTKATEFFFMCTSMAYSEDRFYVCWTAVFDFGFNATLLPLVCQEISMFKHRVCTFVLSWYLVTCLRKFSLLQTTQIGVFAHT